MFLLVGLPAFKVDDEGFEVLAQDPMHNCARYVMDQVIEDGETS